MRHATGTLMLYVFIFFAACPPAAAKPPIPTPNETPVLGEVDRYLIETIYNGADREGSLGKTYDRPAFRALVKKHGLLLFGGPVVGNVTADAATIWVRTTEPTTVRIVAAEGDSPPGAITSETVKTAPAGDLTAAPRLAGLKPFTAYRYNVIVGEKPVFSKTLPSFRTFPAPGQKVTFHVGFGGGARYNPPKERIWKTIAARNPIAVLLLGDNVYIDTPRFRNKQRAYYYRRQLRPEYRALSSTCGIYAIWDDHDFGKNDCAGGLHPFKPAWKPATWKVFCENWPNPYFGGGEKQPGCWFDFSIGDVDFFMTDGRYYRDFKKGTMLGPVQKKWLLEKLAASKATFKVIASGTLWTRHADKGGKDSWWGVKEEREEILSLIDRNNIGGVILLSADRHRTDVYEIKRPKGYTIYEFETSKLTNNHTHGTRKKALFSYNKGNYFGLLTFDLAAADPTVTFRCITIDNEVVYELGLKRSRLQ